jgi:hypothetical protein
MSGGGLSRLADLTRAVIVPFRAGGSQLLFCSQHVGRRLTRVGHQELSAKQLFIPAHACAQRLQHQTHRELVYRPLQFDKRSQLFICAHDETVSAPMCVNNPDRSAFNIQS